MLVWFLFNVLASAVATVHASFDSCAFVVAGGSSFAAYENVRVRMTYRNSDSASETRLQNDFSLTAGFGGTVKMGVGTTMAPMGSR